MRKAFRKLFLKETVENNREALEKVEKKLCEGCFKNAAVKGYYDIKAEILYDVCESCYRELAKEEEAE